MHKVKNSKMNDTLGQFWPTRLEAGLRSTGRNNDKIFIIPVQILKDYIKQNKAILKNVYGGDYKNSKMYLIKYNEFLNYLI